MANGPCFSELKETWDSEFKVLKSWAERSLIESLVDFLGTKQSETSVEGSDIACFH